MSESKTQVDFDEVSKLMSIATAVVNEWPTNTGILSLAQARLKEIELQAREEVAEQTELSGAQGGMPADMQTQHGPVEESFPAEDEDGDGDIDADDAVIADKKNKAIVRDNPTAADAAKAGARRV